MSQWISVDKELPKEHDHHSDCVLIKVKYYYSDAFGKKSGALVGYTRDGDWRICGIDNDEYSSYKCEVIAWMPIPE